MNKHTKPGKATKQADRDSQHVDHVADRPPTEEEEQLAEENDLDPDVAETFHEMAERGARQRGEGRIP